MKIAIVRRLTAAILIAAFAGCIEASSRDVVKKVIFPKGKTSVTFKSRLPRRYADCHAYIVRAKRGQRLSVKLTTAERDASFSIYETKQFGPEEDTIFLQDPAIREHTASLPITSKYSVQVYGVRDIDDRPSGANYYIEIKLN